MKHTVIRSKMKKGKPLMDDPMISVYVPETHWFHVTSLQSMLRTYSTVYIKPDKGRRGNGVIRVKKLNDSESEISYRQTSQRCSTKKLIVELKKILHPKKEYIIQQGIDLATYHHRPFDVRVVLQKPLNRWHLTWISAKVAPRKTSVVTNVSKGAKDVKIIKTLQGLDQPLNVFEVQRELIDISYQMAQILGSHFPFNIVGLDMGIDKHGKIWFIEANTKPDFKGLRKLDRNQYRRYLEAKRLIGKR
ncbi:YheC/YheD family protein [Alicyclobacillus pomorum]|uniref:YheC/YheD family protein n=1 Tax=Alicyclobacillus pomorum TaxID=204470 RepID=UPI00047E77C0|nr:YheC/YheD family protein [Alicyclobacillus pomorum]